MSVTTEDAQLEMLLEFLLRERGFDLSGYKRTTLRRRTAKRLQALGLTTYAEYQKHLEHHPEEVVCLFDSLLVNVSRFFRDPEAWASLEEKVIPDLATRCRDGQALRVWSTGCSTGQEAYTLALILAQELGPELYRRAVKIYATDLDEDALLRARAGTFTDRDLEDVPEPHRAGFERVEEGWQIRGELRRAVVFGRHDLVTDAPISRLDLLMCRNTLMYFNKDTQIRIASRLHFGLRDDGYLFLGKAEMVVARAPMFAAVDLKHRIFRSIPRANGRTGVPASADSPVEERLRTAVFESSPVALVVLDAEERLASANQRARRLFDLAGVAAGTPLKDLVLSYQPLELRSRLEQARRENRAVHVPRVVHEVRGVPLTLDVDITPQFGEDGALLGVVLSFPEVTGMKRLEEEHERRREELEHASEELQSTVEELETTNEELQSTVEELETTNEELQSTNEEMETMNEELQSTNEELQTANDDLRERTADLHRVNSFLESILTSVRTGVVVVDRAGTVMTWNRESEETWGLRREEVYGKRLADLDIGLPLRDLEDPLSEAMSGHLSDELELPAVNRRGKAIKCRVRVLPLVGPLADIQGALLLVRTDGELLS